LLYFCHKQQKGGGIVSKEDQRYEAWLRHYKRWEKENQKRYDFDPEKYHREEKETHEKRKTEQYCPFKYEVE
jgi:hypothetical protein